MGLEWISFFLCFSVVFAFCLCFCALYIFFDFVLVFLRILFLCFYSFLFGAQEILVFHISGSCCRLSLNLRPRGKLPKTCKKRESRSDPVYTKPIRNFPSDAPFSKLRPNDPSCGLTNDTREDPITESSRPITKNNSPKNVWCNVTVRDYKLNYFRIVWWM